jgi:peptidyl-prolyl cis-trans isomerase A (cyclophilin A)
VGLALESFVRLKPFDLLLVAALGLALVHSPGCNAPRDPDLDLRLFVGVEKKGSELGRASPKHTQLRIVSYAKAEIEKILAKVPGPRGKTSKLHVTMRTKKGKILCELDHTKAPQTVANFVALATGQKKWTDPENKRVNRGKFYDGLTFYRAISNFIVQTGNPGSKGTHGPGWKLAREKGQTSRWRRPGAMATVESGSHSHGSQFFITLRKAPELKGEHTPFGVCEVNDALRAIANAPKRPSGEKGKKGKVPVDPVVLDGLDLRWSPR